MARTRCPDESVGNAAAGSHQQYVEACAVSRLCNLKIWVVRIACFAE
jgi:hypothetical protein